MHCIADVGNEAASAAPSHWSVGSIEALLGSPLNGLRTTGNPDVAADRDLFDRLGLHAAGGDA